jgi:hypothetical protein
VHKVKENTPFGKYANVAWAEWAERACGGLWVKRSDQTSFFEVLSDWAGPRGKGGGPRLGWKKNKGGGRAEIKKKSF